MISRTAILSLIVIASTSAAPAANYYARMDAQIAPSESVDKDTYNIAANAASDTIAEIDFYPQDTIDAGYSSVSEDDSLPVEAAESGVPTDTTNDIYQQFPLEPIEAGDSCAPTETYDFSEGYLPPLETYDAGDLDVPTETEKSGLDEILSAGTYEASESDIPYQEDVKISSGFVCTDPSTSLFTILMSIVMI